MPRFVNLPTVDRREASVRSDRVESVIHDSASFQDESTGIWESGQSDSRSLVVTMSGREINVALPKPRVMELLGLHLTGNGEEWV